MWLTPKQAAARIGVSTRTLANYRKGLNLPAGCKPLKQAAIPPGKLIVIKAEWVDEFIEQFATQESLIEKMVTEILDKLKKGNKKRK